MIDSRKVELLGRLAGKRVVIEFKDENGMITQEKGVLITNGFWAVYALLRTAKWDILIQTDESLLSIKLV